MMNKKNVYKLFLFLFMLLAFFISVYPLLWVVIQSLKTETEFLESIWTLPARLNFQNYATAWNDAGMSRYFMNSVVVTLVTTAVNLVFVTCAGYAFAKLTFPGKTFFYYMIIFNLLIPTAIILLPMFTMVNRMHLVNTLPALVFPYFQMPRPRWMLCHVCFYQKTKWWHGCFSFRRPAAANQPPWIALSILFAKQASYSG